jgi:hypothetical protein
MHALTCCRTGELSMVTDQQAALFIEDAERENRILPHAKYPEMGDDGTIFVDEKVDVWVLEPLGPGEGDSVLAFDQDKVL